MIDPLSAEQLAKDVTLKVQAEAILAKRRNSNLTAWSVILPAVGMLLILIWAYKQYSADWQQHTAWTLALMAFALAATAIRECIYLRKRLDALIALHHHAQRNTDL
nr:hypothetical protein [Chromobacterium sp. ASV5]